MNYLVKIDWFEFNGTDSASTEKKGISFNDVMIPAWEAIKNNKRPGLGIARIFRKMDGEWRLIQAFAKGINREMVLLDINR